ARDLLIVSVGLAILTSFRGAPITGAFIVGAFLILCAMLGRNEAAGTYPPWCEQVVSVSRWVCGCYGFLTFFVQRQIHSGSSYISIAVGFDAQLFTSWLLVGLATLVVVVIRDERPVQPPPPRQRVEQATEQAAAQMEAMTKEYLQETLADIATI